jgi:accessory gene regulator B
MPYRGTSGGFHLHTHVGCVIATTLTYCGTAFLSKYLIIGNNLKYVFALIVWIFSIIMIKLYAPADTEDVPILETKVRKKKQIASYIIVTISMIVSIICKNYIISNILIIGTLIQTISITKLAYRLTNNKYGYEVYLNTSN